MNMQTTTTRRRGHDGRRRRARHRRLHRPRIDLRLPQILKAPTAEILDSYRENQTAITGWFLALVISAALLAPDRRPARPHRRRQSRQVDHRRRHRRRHRPGHRPVPVGPADPRRQRRRHRARPHRQRPPHLRTAALLARHHPRRNHRLRPHRDLHRPRRHRLHPQCREHRHATRWIGYLGYASAALIATGVVIPLGSAAPASPTSSATSPGASG